MSRHNRERKAARTDPREDTCETCGAPMNSPARAACRREMAARQAATGKMPILVERCGRCDAVYHTTLTDRRLMTTAEVFALHVRAPRLTAAFEQPTVVFDGPTPALLVMSKGEPMP